MTAQPQDKGPSRLPRRIALSVAALIALLLVVLIAGYLWLLSAPGRDWLRRTLEAALSTPGELTLSIAALQGPLPGSITLRGIELADPQGPWLTAQAASVTWRPLALLTGRLAIDDITVTDLTLARLPESPPAQPQAAPGPFRLPALPLDVTVERLAIEELSLGEAVLGQAARFRVTGAFAARAGDSIRSALRAERSDGPAGLLETEAVYWPSEDRLKLDAKLSAAEQGLLARLLDLPGLPAAEIALAGDGPLADWRGRLTGSLHGLAALQTDLTITRDPDLLLTARGRVETETLPDEPPWPLLAGPTGFELAAAWRPDAVLVLRRLTLEGAALSAQVSGRLDTSTLQSEVTARLVVAESAALDRMIAPAGLRRLEIRAEARGPLLQPAVTFAATAEGFAAPGFAAKAITAQGSAEAEGRLDGPAPRLAIAAKGVLTAPRLDPAEAMAPLLGEAADWAAEGKLDLDSLRFEAARLSLAAAHVSAEGPGTIGLESGAISANLAVGLDDLAALRRLTGLDLGGAGKLQMELDAVDYGAALRATVSGRLSDFRSGISIADPLLGPTPDLGADLDLARDGSLTVTAAHVEGAAAWIAADASLPAKSDTIAASFAAGTERLAALSETLGSRLSGGAELDGTLSGPLDDPQSAGRLTLHDVTLEEIALGRIALTYSAQDLASGPRGTTELAATTPAGRFEGGGDFALREELLALSDLRLSGEGTTLAGDLTVPLGGGAMTGTVTGQVAHLAPWLKLAGQEGDGAAGLRVELAGRAGKQAAQIAANLARLSYPMGAGEALRVEAAEVSASIADLAEPLAADARLHATGVQAAPASLDEVTLQARGDSGGADFTLATRGDLRGKLALDSGGRVGIEDGKASLSLASLQGTLAGRPLALQKPARLAVGADSLRLEDLLVGFSGATVAASASLDRKAVAADLRVDKLPLDLIELAAPQTAVEGSLSGSLQLSGPRDSPSGKAHFETKDLRLKEATDIPAVAAVVDADWSNGRLAAKGSLSGFAEQPATVALQAPLRLDPEALAVTLPRNEPIAGRMAWRGDLGRLWPLVPIDGHRLAGDADLALQLAGTLDDPRLSGRASLANGEYENLEVGTLLKDLSVELELEGEQARLVSLSAGDGNGGRLTAEGTADIAPASGFPFKLSSQFTDFTLVRRDDATAVSDGSLTLSGSARRALVQGKATVKRAEIRISRELPPEVVDLKVVEINSGAVGKRAPEPTTEGAAGPEVALDLTIDMPGRIFVRGQGLDSEWGGHLTITGTADAPIITGDLSVVRGQLTLIGRTFTLEKGVVSFTGSKEINPLLDVAARYERSDLTVTARVTGSAQDPQFSLSSVPTLPQDEIVARVLFDKTTSQLSALEAVQLAQVVADLTGKGGQSEGLLDYARNLIGVDVLRVEAGAGGPEVAAGKYLTEKVYVGVKQGAAVGSGSVGVEVELTPNISLKSDVGQTGESDIGVNFKWDY